MFRFIAFLLIAMCLFWAVFYLWQFYRLYRDNRRRVERSRREFEALVDERESVNRRRRGRRAIDSCAPERISPPVSVKRYDDNCRLETYEDGSQALYDSSGDIVYFRANPELNSDS